MSIKASALQLQSALQSTAMDLDSMQKKLVILLSNSGHTGSVCSSRPSTAAITECDCPLSLISRLDSLDTQFKTLAQHQIQLEADKLAFSTETEQQLIRNAQLLERILAVTEFEGDFQMLHKFSELAQSVRGASTQHAADSC
ncbi:hypothetical protein BASA50_002929 [Batrachochytrium salamandrivorans]|uniref:Uncharacterized protein n=1 Tax=Batrachochytrium salamandrivorans TaxID=1357716 RepID=A0ABQ8FJX5_9FUNG|nr:hypothetical protein BASA60_010151 [Batrachochytrium salamandrivorans]KAH6577594.1 hypothetical protein BASA62_000794 [Batrachochytrium salamandrivorans]KAH6587561.1 hypothetical protein BASA61_006287 [Batrachochytrium salamandrivorans]KAH6599587.1 hypothetical protein BASA50_002929 [Batrachochytrium salamandrivorans]KAH9267989.1 hypothetical protein BASA84_000455 [Batrachochytrium salamandrivorans]